VNDRPGLSCRLFLHFLFRHCRASRDVPPSLSDNPPLFCSLPIASPGAIGLSCRRLRQISRLRSRKLSSFWVRARRLFPQRRRRTGAFPDGVQGSIQKPILAPTIALNSGEPTVRQESVLLFCTAVKRWCHAKSPENKAKTSGGSAVDDPGRRASH
jgi:hypothetical protein